MIDPVLIQFAVGGIAQVDAAFESIHAKVTKLEAASTQTSERGTQARVKIAKTEAELKTREAEKQQKQIDAIHRRSSEMAGKYAAQQAAIEIREAKTAAREIERIEEQKANAIIRSHERTMRAIGKAGARGIGSAVGGMATMVAGGLAIGGGFALADIASKQLAAERQAALIVNEVTVGGKKDPGANIANILGQASQVSRATGMSKEDVLAGTLTYTRHAKGGDFGSAMANMGFFAKLAKTTGSDINAIATGAGTLQSQNPNLKAKDLRQMLVDMNEQGHAGAIPLVEMAGLAGVVGSARGAFSGGAADNQRKLLGLTQLGRAEAGGAEEAARGIKQMALEIEKPEKVALLKSWGVKYNAHGQVESPEQMIAAALKGTDGNLSQLGQVFGARSGGLMRHMAETYRVGGGGDKGQAAAKAEMDSVTKVRGSEESIEAQFQQLMSTPAERFQKALNDVSELVAMRLEPILEKLASKMEENGPAVEKFMTALLDLAEWIIANPWSAVGAGVAASLTKELAAAGIGKLLETALTTKLGAGLAIASAEIALGMAVINLLSEMQVGGQKQAVKETNEASNLAGKILGEARGGSVSPADVKAAQEQAAALSGKLSDQRAAASGSGWSPWSGFLGAEDRKSNAAAEAKSTETALQQLNKAIVATTAHLGNLGATAANVSPDRLHPISGGARRN